MTEIIEREMTEEEKAERAAWEAGQGERDREAVAEARRTAYQLEADPLFFKAQRGAATMEEWKAKVTEIDERYPYAK